MSKDSEKKNKDETKDTTQEEILQEQHEFGLHEDVREKLEKEDERKEPKDKVDADDEVIRKDKED